MSDFLSQLWDAMTAVSLPLLLLAIGLQTAQTLLIALAWRNILRFSYPKGDVTYRATLGYYAGGSGLNAFLPAGAGTVAMLGLFRTSIEGSTVAGLVGATVVQNLFFAIVATLVYLWLFLSVAGSFDFKFEFASDNWVATVVIIVAGIALVVLVVRILWRRLRDTWENTKTGGAIITRPRLYLVEVAGVEAVSYACKLGINATYMHAYNIPVSLNNIFLIIAAGSISSTFAVLPGAVGAQTALVSVALKGVAPQSTITAYTVSQGLIMTAWSTVFGLTMLAHTIGWQQTRKLMHRRKKQEEEAALAQAGAAAGDGGAAEPTSRFGRVRARRRE
ncbi:MAG: lysylphosphatidylglycerol synthase domain-containing protein [Gaiellales bacterium]